MEKVFILWISENDSKSIFLKEEFKKRILINNYILLEAFPNDNIIQLVSYYNFDIIVMNFNINDQLKEKIILDVLSEYHMAEVPIIFYSELLSTNNRLIKNGEDNIIIIYQEKLIDFIIKFYFNHTF